MLITAPTVTQNPAPVHPDLRAVKARQQGAWSAGDYAVIGTTLQIVGEELCEALDIRSGQKVLDVAAGNGNASLAAARRCCDVVATDYVPALLHHAHERASAERLSIEFRPADARSPALWYAWIAAMFEPHASSVQAASRYFVFRYRSPAHWLEVFKTYYGPLLKTFAALSPSARSALEDDMLRLVGEFNGSGDGTMVVPSEYLPIYLGFLPAFWATPSMTVGHLLFAVATTG